jgi:hypothetical protein
VPHAATRPVTGTRQVLVAQAVLFTSVGLVVSGLLLVPAQEWRLTLEFVLEVAGNGLFILACSAVGVLIVSRRPGNLIGWIYALVALVLAASQLPSGYADRSLPGSAWMALLPDLLWVATLPFGVTLLMLLFPTGHLPSQRWRPVVWAMAGATLVVVVATTLFPVAIGIAVMRYRLYDLDRLVHRTLVYGLLTALLGAVYASVVLVLGQLFGGVGRDPPSWAVAGATLAVAALFRPARRRIQMVVDRRFNRRRYNATKTIEVFSGRLREQVDLDTLSAELLAVVDQTMQPTAVSLWLRPPLQRPRTGT